MRIYFQTGDNNLNLNITICDDERNAITVLKKHILQYNIQTDHNIIVSAYLSAEDFLLEYKKHPCDVALLDIEMPGQNGMELARQLREINDELLIVFTTLYPEYMQDSFEVQPFQFLTKPVEYNTVCSLLNNIIKKMTRSSKNIIVLDADGEKHFVTLNNILFISSLKENKSHIRYQLSDQELTAKGTLSEVESRLSPLGFVVPARGFLINIHHIKSLDSTHIILDNGFEIPVSRRRFKDLQRIYSQYIIDIL